MKSIEDKIRDGVVTNCSGIVYRTVPIGDSLCLYRYVTKGRGYRGDYYPEDGYVLVFADISGGGRPGDFPSFVKR